MEIHIHSSRSGTRSFRTDTPFMDDGSVYAAFIFLSTAVLVIFGRRIERRRGKAIAVCRRALAAE
jgi:hypothetical protein